MEREYYGKLRRIVNFVKSLVRERLVSKLPEYIDRAAEHRGDDAREDAQHSGKRVNAIVEGIRRSVDAKFGAGKLESLGRQVATAVSAHQKQELFRQINSAIGVKLETVLDKGIAGHVGQFVSENVSLIKSIPEKYLTEVEQVVLRGIGNGSRAEDIESDISERGDVMQARAQLIARDQVLKFNGALNELRQTGLGITSYVWRTSGDERVRASHQERDGETYQWDDPPGDPSDPSEGGNPGQAINCRCTADPNVDEIIDDLDTQE